MELTYAEIGATRDGNLPAGYRHVRRHAVLGSGEAAFTAAAEGLRHWRMHPLAGLRARADGPAALGARFSTGLGLGPLRIWVPCEVVWFVDEPGHFGFGFGTLPGHPERGEEAFEVRMRDDGTVTLEVRAFSRPAAWYVRLGRPFADRLQDYVTDRYVAAVRQLANA